MNVFEKVDESVASGERILTVSGTMDEWRKFMGYNSHSDDWQVEKQVKLDARQAEYLSKESVRLRAR